MRLVGKVVFDLLSESIDSQAESLSDVAVATITDGMSDVELVTRLAQPKPVAIHADTGRARENTGGSSKCSADSPTHTVVKPWDALPAPALVLIGGYLPSNCLASVRMVCKAWAAHLSEVLEVAMPSTFPLLAHQMACKGGEHCPALMSCACVELHIIWLFDVFKHNAYSLLLHLFFAGIPAQQN